MLVYKGENYIVHAFFLKVKNRKKKKNLYLKTVEYHLEVFFKINTN
jgi:hypothetical protein